MLTDSTEEACSDQLPSHVPEEVCPESPQKGVCPEAPPPLPEGWVVVRHDSGGVVYLHRPSRVCTWARPYSVTTSTTIKVYKLDQTSVLH